MILRAAAEKIAARVPSGWGILAPIDEHTCHYSTGGDDLRWLALRIVMLGVDFEVHEPPELVEHLQALALRLGRATDASATNSWTVQSKVVCEAPKAPSVEALALHRRRVGRSQSRRQLLRERVDSPRDLITNGTNLGDRTAAGVG